MALKNAGRVSPVTRGAYSSSASYERLDIVTDSNGSSWMAKKDSQNVTPAEGEYWQKLGEGVKVDGVTILKAQDGTLSGAAQIDIDSSITQGSTNPVEAGAIYTALAGKISGVSVNGSAVTPDANHNVAITVPTYTLTQDNVDGHQITFTPSNGTATTITIPDTDTWRGIQNNLTSDSTTESLSAAQGTVLKGLVDGKAAASHTHVSADIVSLDASKITTGTIDIERLPQGALERMVVVSTLTDMYSLTTSDVQVGDVVKVTETSQMFYVHDITNLDNVDGYVEFVVGAAASVPWSGVTGKPSTYAPSTHTHSINDVTDYTPPTIPTALQNPYALKLKGAGTQVVSYTGDAETSLNVVGGSGITVTPDATNGTITVAASGLGTAAAKDYTTSVTSGSEALVTSGAVYSAIPTTLPANGGTATNVSGTVAVGNGGTGATSFTSGQVLVGNGTNAVTTKAIDTTPTASSTNLITSGGVAAAIPTIPSTLPNANALTISGGGTQVVSYTGASTGAINIIAGDGVVITPNATNGTITVANAYSYVFSSTPIEAGDTLSSGTIYFVYEE